LLGYEKSREIRWVSCSTHARDEKLIQKSENAEGRDRLQDLGVDERIILNRMLRWIHIAKVGFSVGLGGKTLIINRGVTSLSRINPLEEVTIVL
jgi:hypothetical protein